MILQGPKFQLPGQEQGPRVSSCCESGAAARPGPSEQLVASKPMVQQINTKFRDSYSMSDPSNRDMVQVTQTVRSDTVETEWG